MILLLLIPDIGDQQDIIVYNKKNSIKLYYVVFSPTLYGSNKSKVAIALLISLLSKLYIELCFI